MAVSPRAKRMSASYKRLWEEHRGGAIGWDDNGDGACYERLEDVPADHIGMWLSAVGVWGNYCQELIGLQSVQIFIET